MEADFAAFGSPLCGEVKRFCRRVRETYREIQEDLTPYKDDRYYRYCRDRGPEGVGCRASHEKPPAERPGPAARPWGCSALGMCSGSASRSDSPTPLFLPSPVNALTGEGGVL